MADELYDVAIYLTDNHYVECRMTAAERDRLMRDFTTWADAGGAATTRSGVYDVHVGSERRKLALNFPIVRYIC